MRPRFVAAFLLLAVQLFPWAVPACAASSTLASYTWMADGAKYASARADGSGYVYKGALVFERNAAGKLSLDAALTTGGRITAQKDASTRAITGYTVHHHITDHLGSVRAVVDFAGNVLETSDFLPYGTRWSQTGGSAAGTLTDAANRWRYSGKEEQKALNSALPLIDYGARMYDPAIARWMSVDPLAEKYYPMGGYNYCAGNPANRIDLDGRADFLLKGRVIGNDGIDDKRLLAIRTEALTKKEVKATTRFIKSNSGNSEAFQNDKMAYTNSIAIESSAENRQAMVAEISRDNGRGGTEAANNREYGGTIQNGKVVVASPGPVANPLADAKASISLPGGFVSFHSHPSGSVTENGEERYFVQSPSTEDINTAGEQIHYVFGRRDNIVYVYNKDGVQAVIPMRHFVQPKQIKR